MKARPDLTAADLARLRRSHRFTRLLAVVVVAVCILMVLVLASGAWLALSLSEWGTLTLALGGMALMVGVAWFTLSLVRRQGQILEAGRTLLQLRDGSERAPPPGT